MGVNIEDGKSVYTRIPIEQRENLKLYKTVREAVERNLAPGGTVLDIGCSDLVASRKLAQSGYNVVGVELDFYSLKAGLAGHCNASLVNADALRLPIGKIGANSCALLLDVLEHFKEDKAVDLLKFIGKTIQPDAIILTMPIISIYSVSTAQEFLNMVLSEKRPHTGLFDRTHHILTDKNGHEKIFNNAGFRIVDSSPILRSPNSSVKGRLYGLVTEKIIPSIASAPTKILKQDITNALQAYQYMYIIKKNS